MRAAGLWALLFIVAGAASGPALAITASVDVDDIAGNMVEGANRLPGLVSGFLYAMGCILAVNGLMKLKDHIEKPDQTPLHTPVIRLLAGGALFAIPAIHVSMWNMISGGDTHFFDPTIFTFGGLLSGLLGGLGGLLGGLVMNLNAIMADIIKGVEKLPGLVSAVAYALALIMGGSGVLKIKDHVENPTQTPLRESVTRFVIGGALLALPTVYQAISDSITGGNGVGVMGLIASALGSINMFLSGYTVYGAYGAMCNPLGGILGGLGGIFGIGSPPSLGEAVCNSIIGSAAIPAFLSAMAYLLGLVLGIWGILKIRDHVLNPTQTPVSHGVARLAAGGLFFALPVGVEAIRSTMTPIALTGISLLPVTTYNEQNTACQGLDGALYCLMSDTLGPMHSVLNFFTFVAGIILIMIGISRLIKGAQDGARGPGGLGTLMTFVAGGALISYNEFMRAFTGTIFADAQTLTYAKMKYTDGMSADEIIHAHTVISAILKFLIVVGLISFVRGVFIIRSTAEGSGQASIMAGLTHMVGGALAVNLGPLMNAVQTTLGLTDYGIAFQ